MPTVFQVRHRRSVPISNLTNDQSNTTDNSSTTAHPDFKNLTTPEKSLRKNFGTAMGELFEPLKKKTTEGSFWNMEVASVVNRNKIDEVIKKKKSKSTATSLASDSSTEQEIVVNTEAIISSSSEWKSKSTTDINAELKEAVAEHLIAPEAKLKPRSHYSHEKNSRKRPGSSNEHKHMRNTGFYRDKKLNKKYWDESDFDEKPKWPEKFTSNERVIKNRHGRFSSKEKTMKPTKEKFSSYEKTTKSRLNRYSSNEKKVKYSSSEKTVKNKPEKYSSNEKHAKYRPAKYSSNEKSANTRASKKTSVSKKKKSKPLRESSSEKHYIGRHSSSEKRNKLYKQSDEEWEKKGPGSDLSFEKKKKRFEKSSRENQNVKVTAYEKMSRTKPDAYSELEKDFPPQGSDSSFEDRPKTTRMDDRQSPEIKNKPGRGDSTEEREDNKIEPSDHSEEPKLSIITHRQPPSSASVEEVKTTRKATTRGKIRNLGRQKYLYKRKKALRSTKMSNAYQQEQKLQNKGNDDENLTFTGDLMEKYIDPYLSPYSCKADMEKAALEIEGIGTVETEVVGRTAEYNDIVMLKLTGPKKSSFRFRADAREDKYLDEPPEKKIIFIVHGLNVYGMLNIECLSKMRSLKTLMSYYGKHLETFDIYLIPMANPDGFTYAAQVQMWMKNRSPQALCPGVQVDRNFEVAWKDSPNINSCYQCYPGPTPFSEAESRAIRDVLHKHGQRMIAFINVHASTQDSQIFKGDAVLYPKGYADSNEDTDRYLDMQGEIEEMMRNVSFRHLTVHVNTLKEWYGKVRGTSVDYASSVYGIPYALEFLMQAYPVNRFVPSSPKYAQLALEQIWQRVIDVVFNNINNSHQDQVGFKKL